MTPLEAARRLADDPMESAGCSYCGATSQQQYRGRGDWCHLLSCPTRALPRIVAALEAAQTLTGYLPGEGRGDGECVLCEGVFRHESDDEAAWRIEHADDCPWQALVAALGGERTPA